MSDLTEAQRERRRATQRRQRLKNQAEIRKATDAKAAAIGRWSGRSRVVISPQELDQRLAEIPDDRRTLTGRLCGDPLPGRSALCRKFQEAAE